MMENNTIIQILKYHSVPCYEKDGHVYADSMINGLGLFEEVVDLTGYSKNKLLYWLGY